MSLQDYTDESGIVRLRARTTGGGTQPVTALVVTALDVAVAGDGSPIPFDTVKTDADGYWDDIGKQFVVPAGKAGVFLTGLGISCYGDPAPMTKGRGLVGCTGGLSPTPQSFGLAPDITSGLLSGSTTQLVLCQDGDAIQQLLNTDQPGVATAGNGLAFWLLRLGDLP